MQGHTVINGGIRFGEAVIFFFRRFADVAEDTALVRPKIFVRQFIRRFLHGPVCGLLVSSVNGARGAFVFECLRNAESYGAVTAATLFFNFISLNPGYKVGVVRGLPTRAFATKWPLQMSRKPYA